MATLDEVAQAGIKAINERKFDEAIDRFTEALRIDPERPDMNNALGTAYLHRGEAGSAIPYLERAVELSDPYDDKHYADLKLHFYGGLATAYQLFDRIADARRTLETAVSRWPARPEPRLQLGQLLLTSCQLDQGLRVYDNLADSPALDEERRKAARAVVDASRAFLSSEEDPSIFLRAHQESYKAYFDEIAAEQKAWYAEAARMHKTDAGELRPVLPAGARPYAMSRVDLVDPSTGEVASIYSDTEPMIVTVEGIEPLAQLPIMFQWRGWAFETWVCTQCPWHWLTITVQFHDRVPEDALDTVIADWYLAGYNGDFGDKDAGRFHYVTSPLPYGDRAISYTVDLGRARYDGIDALLKRLTILHERHPIKRLLLGSGHLPD